MLGGRREGAEGAPMSMQVGKGCCEGALEKGEVQRFSMAAEYNVTHYVVGMKNTQQEYTCS